MKKVGILTFHCSDNYGAMLQSYALKTYLKKNNIETEIIRYEPNYLKGKHWLFPYIKQRTPIHTFYWSLRGFISNLKKGRNFRIQKNNMEKFRKTYIYDSNKKVNKKGLKSLPFSTFIVGSDQIWNPIITYGLDGVYFGDFTDKNVISYAASLGGNSLPDEYSSQMNKLVKHLNAISVRESGLIPYIKQFTDKEVLEVLDPVFLLDKNDWLKIAATPEIKDYIIIYETYPDNDLEEKAKQLAKKKNLQIIKLNPITKNNDPEIIENYTSGPSEFLGYINNADYVFTNSFHATAFSILLEKQFFINFPPTVALRLKNIISNFNLTERQNFEKIDNNINWNEVTTIKQKLINKAHNYLFENIK